MINKLFKPQKLLLLCLLCSLCVLCLLLIVIPSCIAESPEANITDAYHYILQGTKAYYEPSEESFAGYFHSSSIVDIKYDTAIDPEYEWIEIQYLFDSKSSVSSSGEKDPAALRTVFVHTNDILTSLPYMPTSTNWIIPSTGYAEFDTALLASLQVYQSDSFNSTEITEDSRALAGLQFICENSPPYKCYYTASNDVLKSSSESSSVAAQAFLFDFAGIGNALNLFDVFYDSDPFQLSYALFLYTGAMNAARNSATVINIDSEASMQSPLCSDEITMKTVEPSEPEEAYSDQLSEIRVSVIDAYSKLPLSGALIVIHDPSEVIEDQKMKTGKDGNIVFSNIPAGSYEIYQQNELKGYEPCNLVFPVSIIADSTVDYVVIPNQPITGDILISVYDKETNLPVPDCEFGVFADHKQMFTLFTDKKGIAVLSNVPTGKYTTKSINFPSGYLNAAQISKQVNVRYNRKSEIRFTINADIADPSVSLSDENQFIDIHISILPQEPSYLGQNSLKFGLFASVCENGRLKVKADSDAILTVLYDVHGNDLDVSLPEGTYCLAKVDEALKCVDPEHCVFFDVNNTTDSIELDPRPASGYPVNLYVSSLTGVGESSTYLHVFSEETDIYRYTDDQSTLQLALFPGQYTAEVVLSPDGYLIPSEPACFEISEKGILTGQTIIRLDPCTLTVKICDTYDVPVEGTFLILRDNEGAHTDIVRSDADGFATFNKVPFGQYEIEELYPAPGYLSNKTRIQITVDGTCHAFDQPLCTLVSHLNSQSFMVTDTEGYPMEHILFSLSDHSGSILEIVSSDSNGSFHFSGIPSGTYTVQPVICDLETEIYPSVCNLKSLPAGVEVSDTKFTLQAH